MTIFRRSLYLICISVFLQCAGCAEPSATPAGAPRSSAEQVPDGGSDLATRPVPTSPQTAPAGTRIGHDPSSAQGADSSMAAAWAGQRADEPFDVRQYLDERAPATDDPRQQGYLAGLGQISGEMGDEQAGELERAIGELADIDRMLRGEVTLNQVNQVLQKAQPALDQIRRAQTAPQPSPPRAIFVYDLRLDALMPHVQAARGLARLMVLETFYARELGQLELALPAVRRNLQLARDLQPRGVLISQLVSVSIEQLTFDAVTRLLLDQESLTPEHCELLLTMLVEHEQQRLPHYTEGLKAEYVNSMNSLIDLRDGRIDREMFWEIAGVSASSVPQEFDAEAELSAMCRLTKLALEEAGIPFLNVPTPSRLATELDALKQSVQAELRRGNRQVPMATLLLMPGQEPSRQAALRSQAGLAGLQCLVALRRYDLLHDSWPASLDEAINGTPVATVPADPFADGPLQYRLIDGQPTVYSVGPDRRDDAGQVDWNYGQQPGDILFRLGRS